MPALRYVSASQDRISALRSGALEVAVGGALSERGWRQPALTGRGAGFFNEAKAILRDAWHPSGPRRRTADHLQHLTIGALASTADQTLPRAIRAFQKRAPEASLKLRISDPEEQMVALQRGHIDVALARASDSQGIEVETVLEETIVAAVPADHPIARQAEISLLDLAGQPLILISDQTQPEFAFQDAAAEILVPTTVHATSDPACQLQLIAAGIGVGLRPAARQKRHHRGVALVPIKETTPKIALAVAWRRDDNRALVRTFVETTRRIGREST